MPPAAASSRWCPTPEQLMILEEMYRGGIRTPNASQIQKITAHLSFYGKIEGKNVFYWFQNHKARDRQKLRRKLTRQWQLQLEQPHQQLYYYHHQPGHQFLNGSSAWQQFSYENSPSLLPQVILSFIQLLRKKEYYHELPYCSSLILSVAKLATHVVWSVSWSVKHDISCTRQNI